MSRDKLVQGWKTEGLKDKAAVPGPRPRLRSCVEVWPGCEDGEYNPACCRFPKSCSCTVYDDAYVSPDDLEEISPRATAATGAVNAKTPVQSERDAELHRYLAAPGGVPAAGSVLPEKPDAADTDVRLERVRELNQEFFEEITTWGGCDIDTPGFCRRCFLVAHYHQVKRALEGDI